MRLRQADRRQRIARPRQAGTGIQKNTRSAYNPPQQERRSHETQSRSYARAPSHRIRRPSILGLCFAQGWIEYHNRADFFSVNFPGEPKVRDISYRTEYFITLPGRVYSYENGPNRYSVTVVDYTNLESLEAERVKSCQAAGGDGDSCNNHGARPWGRERVGLGGIALEKIS